MINIYCDSESERLDYILKVFFNEIFDIPFKLTNSIPDTIHINYSQKTIPNTFQIIPNEILFEKQITHQNINVIKRNDHYKFSFFESNGSVDFDIFGAAFYLISRYEEYLPNTKDNHQRYLAYQSLAYQEHFLELPLINIWAVELKKVIETQFSINIPLKNSFKIINTIDIDNAFAYKNKGFYRTTGANFKNFLKGSFKEIATRKKVITGQLQDPYNSFEYLKHLTLKNEIDTIFFVLLGDYGGYDKNISHLNSEYNKLLQSLGNWSKIGIHPSYKSYLDKSKIETEIKRLSTIINSTCLHSRQHYLKLSLPESYRILVDLNIINDYTMGYAEAYGFRASICTPYTFFDLHSNQSLNLTIHPFAYMDGTLNEYFHLSPEEAIDVLNNLKNEVKDVNGHFIGIWHNDTVNENHHWKGWQKVFEEGLKKI
jgi:hypothetical protein